MVPKDLKADCGSFMEASSCSELGFTAVPVAQCHSKVKESYKHS